MNGAGTRDPGRRLSRAAWLCAVCGVSLGCSVGSGAGSVQSDNLFVQGCWEGPFDLEPTFFAANPFANTLSIRVQRGEQDIQVSDGFTMLVNDVALVRSNLEQELQLGLPVGVAPLGFALPDVPEPRGASLSLYLNNSCRGQNVQLVAVDGGVTFEKIFSGDLNEENADDRLTSASFWATVADPHDAVANPEAAPGAPAFTFPAERTSRLVGEFRFYFHRGTPAQPFP